MLLRSAKAGVWWWWEGYWLDTVRQTSSVAGAWLPRMSSELRASRSRALLSGRTSSVHMQRRDDARRVSSQGASLRKSCPSLGARPAR